MTERYYYGDVEVLYIVSFMIRDCSYEITVMVMDPVEVTVEVVTVSVIDHENHFGRVSLNNVI